MQSSKMMIMNYLLHSSMIFNKTCLFYEIYSLLFVYNIIIIDCVKDTLKICPNDG